MRSGDLFVNPCGDFKTSVLSVEKTINDVKVVFFDMSPRSKIETSHFHVNCDISWTHFLIRN